MLELLGQLVLDVGHQVAVVCRGLVRVEHLEGVQRVAVQRGVDLGLHDAEADALEECADLREQVLAVGRIDHHLHPFADRAQPRLHDRLWRVDAVVQQPGVPGDFTGVMAQEVGRVELRPQLLVNTLGQRVQFELLQGQLLTTLQPAAGRIGVASQEPPRRPVQVLEQLALPCVPHFRAGAADVSDGQHIQGIEPPLVAHQYRQTRR